MPKAPDLASALSAVAEYRCCAGSTARRGVVPTAQVRNTRSALIFPRLVQHNPKLESQGRSLLGVLLSLWRHWRRCKLTVLPPVLRWTKT
jgi:hypothetical protein